MVQQWLVLRWQRVGRRRWDESANKVGNPTSVEWITVFPAIALQVGVPRNINVLVGGQIHHAQLSVIHAHATAKYDKGGKINSENTQEPRELTLKVNGKRDRKADTTPGHAEKSHIEPLIIVEPHGVSDEGTVVIKQQHTTTRIATVFGSKGSKDVTCVTQLLFFAREHVSQHI